jgi:hypothetical protein
MPLSLYRLQESNFEARHKKGQSKVKAHCFIFACKSRTWDNQCGARDAFNEMASCFIGKSPNLLKTFIVRGFFFWIYGIVL